MVIRTEKPERTSITIRLAPAFRARLNQAYWKTASKHARSQNGWLESILEREVERIERRNARG